MNGENTTTDKPFTLPTRGGRLQVEGTYKGIRLPQAVGQLVGNVAAPCFWGWIGV